MTILIEADRQEGLAEWRALFRELMPGRTVGAWNDPEVDRASVHYAFCYAPEPGWLASLPNLRLICAASVGVDNIVRDPTWSRAIPLVRMACPETGARMADYVAWATLSLHRGLFRLLQARERRAWDRYSPPVVLAERRVGILGLGNLGTAAAEALVRLGVRVSGWSRGRKSIDGVASFAGPDELEPFLRQTDILVCLMPGTPETAGILNGERLAMLPEGAGLVNAARSSHLVVPDLLAALDAGHLSGAILDVFDTEPLPPEDPLWGHPKVLVTSHLASTASRRSRARWTADVIDAFERGEALPNRYDPDRGY